MSAAGTMPFSATDRRPTDPPRFDIASDYDAGRAVQEAILDDVAHARFDENSAFALKLALEEALINAIKHGNRLDTAKRVRVWADVTPQAARITIEDEGPGFDRDGVPDPTLEENIEKCSGRGILLIEAYMNEVVWSDHGRRLSMVKRNDGRAAVRTA